MLGSCYLTETPGGFQLSPGVIAEIVGTASAHCTRPNQPDQRGTIRGQKRLHQAKAWCNLVLYSFTGSARLVRSHNWAFRGILLLRVSTAATLVKPVRGLSRRSSFLTCDLPQTAPPPIHLLAACVHQKTPSPLLSIVYAVALGSYRPSLDSLSRTTTPTRHLATALAQRYTITLHCTAHNLRHCLLSLLRRILHPLS